MDWGERYQWIVDNLHAGNQAEAGRAIGVTRAAMGNLLRGAIPKGDTVAATAVAYPNLSCEWLLLGVGDPLLPMEREAMNVAMQNLERIRGMLTE